MRKNLMAAWFIATITDLKAVIIQFYFAQKGRETMPQIINSIIQIFFVGSIVVIVVYIWLLIAAITSPCTEDDFNDIT